MSKENFVRIGKLGKSFGVEGEIRCHIDPRFKEDFLNSPVLFLNIGGNKTPFFVQEIYEGEDLSVILEDVGSKEAAMKLSGGEVWLREKDLHTIPVEKVKTLTQYERLLDFEITDLSLGLIGKIQSFLEMPQQILLQVDYQGKEVFIPFQEALVQEIDFERQLIKMDLPEGILEL